MANQITGRIYKILPTQTFVSQKSGNTSHMREIVLDASRFDQYTGEKKYDNYPGIVFWGDEQCARLDAFKEGELVTVSFDLNGTQYQDKQTGETKYFTRVKGYKIERAGDARSESRPQAPSEPSASTLRTALSHGEDAPQPQQEPDDLPF